MGITKTPKNHKNELFIHDLAFEYNHMLNNMYLIFLEITKEFRIYKIYTKY